MNEKQHPTLPYTFREDGTLYKIKGKGLKVQTIINGGYLSISYRRRTYLIHRLMWETFHGEIPKHLQINHIDGDKTNNHLSNLELVTPQENMRHAVRLGLKAGDPAEKNSRAKLTNEQYLEIIEMLVQGRTNDDIANHFGLHSRYISLVRHRKRLKSMWELYENSHGEVHVDISNGAYSKIPLSKRVEIIRKLPYFSNKELAREVNLDCSCISKVRHRESWKDAWKLIDLEGATAMLNAVDSSESKREATD